MAIQKYDYITLDDYVGFFNLPSNFTKDKTDERYIILSTLISWASIRINNICKGQIEAKGGIGNFEPDQQNKIKQATAFLVEYWDNGGFELKRISSSISTGGFSVSKGSQNEPDYIPELIYQLLSECGLINSQNYLTQNDYGCKNNKIPNTKTLDKFNILSQFIKQNNFYSKSLEIIKGKNNGQDGVPNDNLPNIFIETKGSDNLIIDRLELGTDKQIKYKNNTSFTDPNDLINKNYSDNQKRIVEQEINANKIDIANNSLAINTNTTSIGVNKTSINTNTSNITSNTTAINTNAASIGQNKFDIASNDNDINTNTTSIGVNKTSINTNTSNITSNTTAINTNAASIGQNKFDIASNDNDINTNTASITANKTDIDNNAMAIKNEGQRINTNANNISILESEVEEINNDLNFIVYYNDKTGSKFLVGDSGRELTTTITLNNTIKKADGTPLDIFMRYPPTIIHEGYTLKSKINDFDSQRLITVDGKIGTIKTHTIWTPQGSPTSNDWEVKVTLTSTIVSFFHYFTDSILTKIITNIPKHFLNNDFSNQDASKLGSEGQTIQIISGELKGVDVGIPKVWKEIMDETGAQEDTTTKGFSERFFNLRPIPKYFYKVQLAINGVTVAGYDRYFFLDQNHPNFLTTGPFHYNGKNCVLSLSWTILSADETEFKLYATADGSAVQIYGGNFKVWMYLEA